MPRGVYIRTKPVIRPKRHIPPCTVSGCQKMCRSAGSVYCEKHYMRVRRHGNVESYQRTYDLESCEHIDIPTRPRRKPKRYAVMRVPGHPLAAKDGSVYVHRYAYYKAYGAGPFRCHWCGKDVTWKTLHIDHLNDIKTDNQIENLAATCAGCNLHRGAPKALAKRRLAYSQFLSFQGRCQTVAEWAAELGMRRNALKWRLNNGWPVERVLTEPKGNTGPRRYDG